MTQALTLIAVAVILALALLLIWQLLLVLPRSWQGAAIGQIVFRGLGALGAWLVAWLGLVLGVALLPHRPPRWVISGINIGLIGALLAILAAVNAALWRWRRAAARRARWRAARRDGVPD